MKYHATYETSAGPQEQSYGFVLRGDRLVAVVGEGDGARELDVELIPVGDGNVFSLLVDGLSRDVFIESLPDNKLAVQLDGERIVVTAEDDRTRAARAVAASRPAGKLEVEAVMPGVVVEVRVAEGDEVEEGDVLVILEAMKMQNPIHAERAGKVTKVACSDGEAVAGGALLVVVE